MTSDTTNEGERVTQEYGLLQTDLTEQREQLVIQLRELSEQLEPLEDKLWELWSSFN